MNFYDMCFVLFVFLLAYNNYLYANRINDRVLSDVDKYLPKKKIPSDGLYWFYNKKPFVRWHAYWIETFTQIFMLLYIIVLIMMKLIVGDWSFMTKQFNIFWISLFYFFPLILVICINIYIIVRKAIDME